MNDQEERMIAVSAHDRRNLNDDFYDNSDFISEIDFARSEGFEVDDDGHWVPMEDDDDDYYGGDDIADFGDDDDDGFDVEYENEVEFARSEDFYLDDDGNWIPSDDGWG